VRTAVDPLEVEGGKKVIGEKKEKKWRVAASGHGAPRCERKRGKGPEKKKKKKKEEPRALPTAYRATFVNSSPIREGESQGKKKKRVGSMKSSPFPFFSLRPGRAEKEEKGA